MIEIKPATLRDASYVMANMRAQDQAEVMCQVPAATKTHELAYHLLMGSEAFAASYNGQPAVFFGTSPINVACLSIWAVGTKRMQRAVPAVTKFLRGHVDTKVAQGYRTIEARSLETHYSAHRWIEGAGGVRSGEPFVFGRDGEKFLLFRWTAPGFGANKAEHRSEA